MCGQINLLLVLCELLGSSRALYFLHYALQPSLSSKGSQVMPCAWHECHEWHEFMPRGLQPATNLPNPAQLKSLLGCCSSYRVAGSCWQLGFFGLHARDSEPPSANLLSVLQLFRAKHTARVAHVSAPRLCLVRVLSQRCVCWR